METETSTKPDTAKAAGKSDHFPPQIKYIIWNEACERFSYYGMFGILQVYLANRMGMGAQGATERLHFFGTAVYFMPLFGGWLADRWLGRYWTILSISLFYCLGHGTLALFEGSSTGLFVGLALIAIGAGGIKPCVSAFVGDQFGPNQDRALTRVYGWFYWAINLGATAGFLVIPYVHEKAGYRWAFGVPGIFMALATLVFWLGTKHYVRQPPAAKQRKQAGFIAVVWHAWIHRHERRPGQQMFDVALAVFNRDEVEGAKAVIGILKIFITVPVFWALFNQVDSTWVVQGNKMTTFDLLGYQVDGERMQAAGSILVMIWVPILTFIVYPLLERFGVMPTALRRMSAGMMLGAVSFVISGLLQWYMDRGATLNVAWQLVPYVVLEAGEVMLSATALEFAFSQAPASMKSTITSFWLMTIAGGHFLVAEITNLNETFVHARGAIEFWFYAALMFVVAGIFIFCASRYRERTVTEAGSI
jgi:POT family proton-dependent oligopeptide transporter